LREVVGVLLTVYYFIVLVLDGRDLTAAVLIFAPAIDLAFAPLLDVFTDIILASLRAVAPAIVILVIRVEIAIDGL
jgi:hypothetical protein